MAILCREGSIELLRYAFFYKNLCNILSKNNTEYDGQRIKESMGS